MDMGVVFRRKISICPSVDGSHRTESLSHKVFLDEILDDFRPLSWYEFVWQRADEQASGTGVFPLFRLVELIT